MINTIPITDLKQNLAKVVNHIRDTGRPMYIMQRSKATAVILDLAHYHALEEALADQSDTQAVRDRLNEKRVDADQIVKNLGLK